MDAIVLSAGKSSRMKSHINKLTFKILGKRVIDYVSEALINANINSIIYVVGKHNCDMELLNDKKKIIQDPPLGTGHAIQVVVNSNVISEDSVIILAGDIPLITADSIKEFIHFFKNNDCDIAVLTTKLSDPGTYGRIIRDKEGELSKIVEFKDANSSEREIKEINTGIYIVKSNILKEIIFKLKDSNEQKEFYLTDIIELGLKEKKGVKAFLSDFSEDFLGVNTPAEMAEAIRVLKLRKIYELSNNNGVMIIDPATTFIDWDVEIGSGTIIYPGTIICGNTTIGIKNIIGPFTNINNANIGNENEIRFSVISDSKMGDNNIIGPYAHIRPGTVIHFNCKIGNFVEIKNSELEYNVKASHLTYLGDSFIGENTNIGAGTITCNYDGIKKNRTNIGKNVFIGSNSALVAPVKIGNSAYIGAGSIITKDIPEFSLGIAREKQVNIKNWVVKKRKIKERGNNA